MARFPVIKIVFAVVLLGLLIFFSNARAVKVLRESMLVLSKPLRRAAGEFRPEAEPQFILADMAELAELRRQNLALKNALGFKEERGINLRGARVLTYGQEFGKEFLLIDQGTAAGIQKNDLALDENRFFVGKVAEVYAEFSRVELASNPGEVFEVSIAPLGVRALAKGLGGRIFSLELLPASSVVRTGDLVSLLGIAGNRYAFSLAEVLSVQSEGGSAFKDGRASLVSHPETLREVFITESRQ